MGNSEMQRPEFKPIIIEVAELGKEIIKFTFSTPEEYAQWWTRGEHEEFPRFGEEALDDF